MNAFIVRNEENSAGCAFIYIQRIVEWLKSFNVDTGRFDPCKCIKLEDANCSLHHYIDCSLSHGFTIWSEGNVFVDHLTRAINSPVVGFQEIISHKGEVRLFAIISLDVIDYGDNVRTEVYGFGVSLNGLSFHGVHQTFNEHEDFQNSSYYQAYFGRYERD